MDEDLKLYYIEIAHSHIAEMKTKLILSAASRKPSKMLFTGHRGCGKTTALHKLISELVEEEFFIVYYSVFDALDINDLSYIDVLFSMVTKMLEEMEKEGVTLSDEVQKRLDKWGSKTVETMIKEGKIEKKAGLGLKIFFVDLMARIKNEETTRIEIRKEIEPKITELIDILNDMVTDVERSYKNAKQVLFIVDDLEKADIATAKNIFYEHNVQLTQPISHIIYTIPIALHYSREAKQIDISFDWSCAHPNVNVFNRDDSENEEGWGTLKSIISQRADIQLFTSDALDYIIKNSGGVIREMVRIIQDSASENITKGKDKIDLDTVESIVSEMSNTYRKQLSAEDYDVLKDINSGNKDVRRDEKLVGLLHNLSVLEYKNHDIWCDVNPIIKQFLK